MEFQSRIHDFCSADLQAARKSQAILPTLELGLVSVAVTRGDSECSITYPGRGIEALDSKPNESYPGLESACLV